MTKKEAIEALDHLLYIVDKRDNRFDIWVWHHRCIIELEKVFGKDSTQVYHFNHGGGFEDSDAARIRKYRALIEEYKGHVHRHGLPEDEVSYNPITVTRAEFFDAIKKIPFGRLWSICWPTFAGVGGAMVTIVGIASTIAYHLGTHNVNSTALDFRNDNIRLTTENDTLTNRYNRLNRSYKQLEAKVKTLPDSVSKQYRLP